MLPAAACRSHDALASSLSPIRVTGQSSLAEGNGIHIAITYGVPAVCYVGTEISGVSQSNTGSAVMEGEAEYYLRLDIQILARLLITYGTSLCLNFPICKMGIIVVLTS